MRNPVSLAALAAAAAVTFGACGGGAQTPGGQPGTPAGQPGGGPSAIDDAPEDAPGP